MHDVARRRFLVAGAGLAASLLLAPPTDDRSFAQGGPASVGPADPKLIEDLVAANRILVDQGVLDGYGHVSVRRPRSEPLPMSRSIAPELSPSATFWNTTSTARRGRRGRGELPRALHPRRDLQARPDVIAVVHSHSPSVIPFGVTGAPLRPLRHERVPRGGAPVFDIRVASGG